MIDIPGFQGEIYRDYSLAKYTTWRIGGPAELLTIAKNLDDLLRLLYVVKAHGIPLFVLGRGSNVLVDSKGLPGITVRFGNGFQYLDLQKEARILTVGAGFLMPTLAKRAADAGWAGFEHLIGIPGAVGAGIVINAGKGGNKPADMASILQSVTYIDSNLQLVKKSVEELSLGYRTSNLKDSSAIVVEAVFHPTAIKEPDELHVTVRNILAERRLKFPLNYPNSGSVFKRPDGYPPAGWLIEKAGLKGCRLGDAQISEKHANFVINLGQAASHDVQNLIDLATEKVFSVHGVVLEKENIYMPEQRNW
jgi:UDP-N-acetylmuramate dehydrogenase